MSIENYLDVTKGDFDHDLELSELWQKNAQKRLIDALEKTTRQASLYKSKRSKAPNLIQPLHDTIFVAAPRGAGKTVFLHNLEKMWEEREQKETRDADIYFCSTIDPTLLVDNDNFANVVIAHLYNEVDNHIKTNQQDQKNAINNFYNDLSKLADSLSQTEYMSGEISGIDRIISYRSGIQLEKHFHKYVESCITILNSTAIALPIDDVDMSLNKAPDVLDVVRRLLSCPYIIPIVSGDESLYEPIIRNNFLNCGAPKNNDILESDQAKNLTQDYMTKIFPSNLRVSLLPLDAIIPTLWIKDDKDKEIQVAQYFELFQKKFCPWANGEEKSFDWPRPRNARELAQLCYLFPPSRINKEETTQDQWYEYQLLADSSHNGTAYLVAHSEQQLVHLRSNTEPTYPLRELPAFNVVKQAHLKEIDWKQYSFYNVLKGAMNSLKADTSNRNWLEAQKIFISEFTDPQNMIARPMPTVEFYSYKISISIDKNNIEGPNTALLLALYTHYSYYGTSRQRSAQLFFGRAFELVTSSLLLAKPAEDKNSEARKQYWKDFLLGLLHKAPFHSVYSLAPTKTFDFKEPKEKNPHKESGYSRIIEQPADLDKLAESIKKWELAHKEILEKAQEKGLTHLLIYVMNKVFTQLHCMRADGNLKNDSLACSIKRFEYIMINAFASFLKPAPVVQQNIAADAQTATIMSDKGMKQDASFRDNIAKYIGLKESTAKGIQWSEVEGDFTDSKSLLRAIWRHPVFELKDKNTADIYFSSFSSAPQKTYKRLITGPIKRKLSRYTDADLDKMSLEALNKLQSDLLHEAEKRYGIESARQYYMTKKGEPTVSYRKLLEAIKIKTSQKLKKSVQKGTVKNPEQPDEDEEQKKAQESKKPGPEDRVKNPEQPDANEKQRKTGAE
ncbi:MAG: hypothetical protein GY737_00790 [Desulfobacteraceae bacterium]|nr:hypothetical protein [Desulfobacteraceae bacterium]